MLGRVAVAIRPSVLPVLKKNGIAEAGSEMVAQNSAITTGIEWFICFAFVPVLLPSNGSAGR
jgi:hypothetical protein